MAMQLTSSAFAEGDPIPRKHTADGADLSPPLRWTDLPPETASCALVCEDPDAPVGNWVHWVIWNIPAKAVALPEGVSPVRELPDGARQGKNDFNRPGYGGPAPPPGRPHRYFFRFYALDAELGVEPGASKADVVEAMRGHILAEAQLMGTYGR